MITIAIIVCFFWGGFSSFYHSQSNEKRKNNNNFVQFENLPGQLTRTSRQFYNFSPDLYSNYTNAFILNEKHLKHDADILYETYEYCQYTLLEINKQQAKMINEQYDLICNFSFFIISQYPFGRFWLQ